MNVHAALQNCPLFAGLNDAELDQMVAIGRSMQEPKGTFLFAEGETATGFYVVLTGRVKVFKVSADGKERILHIVPPGQSFADAAIFGNGLYPAAAEVLDAAKLFFLPRDAFLGLLRTNSQMAINMIGGLSRFLRQFAGQIEELTFKDVPARLAKALLDFRRGTSTKVVLPMSKGALASNLGTVSETLSRTFRKMADEGLIKVEGREITLLDMARIEEIAYASRER